MPERLGPTLSGMLKRPSVSVHLGLALAAGSWAATLPGAPVVPTGPVQLGESLDRVRVHFPAGTRIPDALFQALEESFSKSRAELTRLLDDAARIQRADEARKARPVPDYDLVGPYDLRRDPFAAMIPLAPGPRGTRRFFHPRSASVLQLVPPGPTRRSSWLERPARTLRWPGTHPFLIERDEVTVARYQRFLEATGHPPPRTWQNQTARVERPVTDVTWDSAAAYAHWAGLTLPTEGEWERACFGAGGHAFPWGNRRPHPSQLPGVVGTPVSYRTRSEHPRVAGSIAFDVSEFGVRDMVWNLREWIQVSGVGAHMRIAKGGAFVDDVRALRHLWGRTVQRRRVGNAHTGFRCALPLRLGRLDP